MNRLFHYLSVAMACLASAACSSDLDRMGIPFQPGEGDITVDFEVDGEMPLTRGIIANEHETTLKTVHILFFDKTMDDEFAGYVESYVGNGKKQFSFDVPETLNPETPYSVLAIGNADYYLEDQDINTKTLLEKYIKDGASYNDIIGALAAFSEKAITSDNAETLPLWGKYLGEDNLDAEFRFTLEGNKQVIEKGTHFFFSRTTCRIDLHNLVGQQLKIIAARVVNNRTAGLYFMDGLNTGEQQELVPQEAPAGMGYMPVTKDMVEGESTTQRIQASLYTFPNTLATSVVNDKKTTALMIAGYWYDSESQKYDDQITYYRFNLANAGESQALQRNYCYVATIKGVKRRGADNESDAYNDSSPIFVYDVDEEWDTTGDNVVTDEDGNFLIVNKTHLTFTGEMKENDYIELRVSTNPELTWTVEWDAQPGNRNELFNFSKISDSAVKCGPVAENHSNYVHYGYLHIVATNPATGKVLRMPIYLMQLSTSFNVKTLSVNGNTGTFTQELNPDGGTISLLVVTGSKFNTWTATDENSFVGSWGAGCSFTKAGGDKTYITITYPSNTSTDYLTGEHKTKTATITISLDDNDIDSQGNKIVKDVVINLIQKPSARLMDIIGFRDGGFEIDCFDPTPGNVNGVVNTRRFTVNLTDPDNYYFKVSSTFDQYRDLTLSLDRDLSIVSYGTSYARATHPTDPESEEGKGKIYEFNEEIIDGDYRDYDPLTGERLYDLESGRPFYINPFRMGPGDPSIKGTIFVTAYPKQENKNLRTETIPINIILKSTTCHIGDVAIDAMVENKKTLIILADRNVETDPLWEENATEPESALYNDIRPEVIITGALQQPSQQTTFLGMECEIYKEGDQYSEEYYETQWKKANKYMKPTQMNNFYQNSLWTPPRMNYLASIHNKIVHSKERAFVVSDYKYNGLYVVCWLPRRNDKYVSEFWRDSNQSAGWSPYNEEFNITDFNDALFWTGSFNSAMTEVRLCTTVPENNIQTVLDMYGYKK